MYHHAPAKRPNCILWISEIENIKPHLCQQKHSECPEVVEQTILQTYRIFHLLVGGICSTSKFSLSYYE